MKSGYKFLEAFVYPATLGAALAWCIQALATAFDGSPIKPSVWALFFGLWFVLYHSIWYWFLVNAPKDSNGVPEQYDKLSFVTDLIDTIAMMTGIASLGFASGHYDTIYPGLTFIAVLIIILSAATANHRRKSKAKGGWKTYNLPFVLVTLIPVVGLLHYFFGLIGDYSDVLLFLLYLGLLCYALCPAVFSSHRSPNA